MMEAVQHRNNGTGSTYLNWEARDLPFAVSVLFTTLHALMPKPSPVHVALVPACFFNEQGSALGRRVAAFFVAELVSVQTEQKGSI